MNPFQPTDSTTTGLWINSHHKLFSNDAKLLSTQPRRQSVLSQNFSTATVGTAACYASPMDTESVVNDSQTESFVNGVFMENSDEQANIQTTLANELDALNLDSIPHSISHDVLNDFASYSSVPSSPNVDFANSIGVPYVEQVHSPTLLSPSNTFYIPPSTPQLIRLVVPQTPPTRSGIPLKELIPIVRPTTPQFAKPTQKDVWTWLCEIALQEYYQDFIDNGFDDLETIAGLNEEEIKGLFHAGKYGHLKKLTTKIAELKIKLTNQPKPAPIVNHSPLQVNTLDLAEVHRTNANSVTVRQSQPHYPAKKNQSKKTATVSPGPMSPTASENDDSSTPATPSFGPYQSPNANVLANDERHVQRSSSEDVSELLQDESDEEEYVNHGFSSDAVYNRNVTLKWLLKGAAKRKREDKISIQNSVENPLHFVQGKKLQPHPILEIQPEIASRIQSVKITLWKCDVSKTSWKPCAPIEAGLEGEVLKDVVVPNSGNNIYNTQIRFDKVKLKSQPKEEKKSCLYCFRFLLFSTLEEKPVFKLYSHKFTILSHNSQRLKSPQNVALMSVQPDFGGAGFANSTILFGNFPLIPDYRIYFDRLQATINYAYHRPPCNMLSVFTPRVDIPCRVDIHLNVASFHHTLPSSYAFLTQDDFEGRIRLSGSPDNNNSGSRPGGNSPQGPNGRNSPNSNDPNNNNFKNLGANFSSGSYQGGRQQPSSTGEDSGSGQNPDKKNQSDSDSQDSEDSQDSAEENDYSDSGSGSGSGSGSDEDDDDQDEEDSEIPGLKLGKIRPKNINDMDSFGFAVIHRVVSHKKRDYLLAILSFGAEINIQDKEGYTPLMWSVAVQDLIIAETLLAFHADPNVADVYGLTPLHAAVGLEAEETATAFVTLLVKYKADVHAEDIYKESPVDYAKELGKEKLVNIMLKRPMREPESPPLDPVYVPEPHEPCTEEFMNVEPLQPTFNDPLTTSEPPITIAEPPITIPEPPITTPEPLPPVKESVLNQPKVFLQKTEKDQKPREYDVSLPHIAFGINPDHYDSLIKLTISKCPNLKTLPYNIARCSYLDSITVDWKECKKISDPPREIIEKGAFAVREHMEHVLSGETTTLFSGRSKIIVLGPSLAGKTSMLKVLNALRASYGSLKGLFFKPNPQDFAKLVSGGLRTLGVDVNNRETRFGDNESEFMTYDFGGEPEFAAMYRHFISAENALYVITFDISSDENTLYQQVRDWVEFLKLYIPDKNFRENKIRLILIGNKVDKLVNEEIFRRLQLIRDRTEEFINCPVIGTSCMKLQFHVIDIDGKRRTGDFYELSSIIAREARRVNATARIPQLFKTIQDTIEWTMEQQASKSSDVLAKLKGLFVTVPEDHINYIFSWPDFVIWCQSMGFDCEEKLLMQVADYLHTVGTAIVSKQTRAVCVDPRKFGKILGAFLAETTKSKLQFLEKDFENSGIVESKTVPTIFEKLLASHGDFTVHADDSKLILQVMENYDLCFRLPKSDNALFPSLRRSGKPAFPVVLRNKTDRMDTNTPDKILCFSLRIACEPGAKSFFRSFQIGLSRDFMFQSMYHDSVSVKDSKTDTWLLASLHKESINVVIMGEQPARMNSLVLDKIRYLRNDLEYSILKLCPKCCFEDPMASSAQVLEAVSINQQKLLKCPLHGKLAEEPKNGYKIPAELQSSANQITNVRAMEENEVSAWELYTPSLSTSWDKWGNLSFRRMILKKPFPRKTTEGTEERYHGVLTSDIPEIERVENAWKSMLGSRIGEFEITRITVLQNPQQEKIFQERWMQLNAQGLTRDSMESDSRMQTFVSECSKLYHCSSEHYSNANSFTSLRANLAVGWWNGKTSQFPVMADNSEEYAIENGSSGKGYYFRPYPLMYTQDQLSKCGYETESVMLCWVMLGNTCTVEGNQQVPNGTHDSVFRVIQTPDGSSSHEITVFDKCAILPRYVVNYRLMNAVLWIDDHHHTNNRLSLQKITEYGTHVFTASSKEEARNWLSNKHNIERYRSLPGDRFRIVCNKALMLDSTNPEARLGANSLYGYIRSTWNHTPIMIFCGKYEDKLWMPDNKLLITTNATNMENFALMEPLSSIKRHC